MFYGVFCVKRKYKLKRYKLIKWNKNKIFALCVILMIALVVIYICGQIFCEWEKFDETITTILAIIGAIAFWLEYHENKLLNEAQFITDLNEQFIGDENMSAVEWELEKYFNKFRTKKITSDDNRTLEEKYSLENRERQHLVNYLVHLEGIAALVKNNVLHIDTIDDLMSFRYFIAMNNPVVQKLELLEYPDYYKGCFDIYDAWVKELKRQNITPPMYDENSNNLTKKLKEQKLCQQKRK